MSKPIEFYFDLLCPPSRALSIFFKVIKFPVVEFPVALRKNEQLSDKFRSDVNKFGKLPVIHDGDFRLSESNAIFRYLHRKYKFDDFWYPEDVKKRALVDEYCSWTHNNIRFYTGMYLYAKWRDPIVSGNPENVAMVAIMEHFLTEVLDVMENVWMEKPYIIGDHLSIADLFAASDLEQIKITGLNPFDERPRLTNWYNKVKTRLDPYFSEQHKYVYKHAEETLKRK